MDTDRRRKTVIADTFAIGRKSLSNAQPISADETQRTKAETTMVSTHMPTLHKARAERHLRRVTNHVFHSAGSVSRAHPLEPGKLASGTGQGKSRSPDLRFPSNLPISHFYFSQPQPRFCFPHEISCPTRKVAQCLTPQPPPSTAPPRWPS
jgi:hypothetical protein